MERDAFTEQGGVQKLLVLIYASFQINMLAMRNNSIITLPNVSSSNFSPLCSLCSLWCFLLMVGSSDALSTANFAWRVVGWFQKHEVM